MQRLRLAKVNAIWVLSMSGITQEGNMQHSMLKFGVAAMVALTLNACGDSGGGGPEPTSS